MRKALPGLHESGDEFQLRLHELVTRAPLERHPGASRSRGRLVCCVYELSQPRAEWPAEDETQIAREATERHERCGHAMWTRMWRSAPHTIPRWP